MIDEQKIESEIRTMVAKIVKEPEAKIKLESDLFDDLGVDSLSGVEIFAALDTKYGIAIPETKLHEVTTLKDLIDLAKEQIAAKVSK